MYIYAYNIIYYIIMCRWNSENRIIILYYIQYNIFMCECVLYTVYIGFPYERTKTKRPRQSG